VSLRVTDWFDGAVFEFEDVDAYLASDWWLFTKFAWERSGRPKGCYVCGRLDTQLHHTRYDRLGMELDDLVPLCEDHHYEVEKFLKMGHSGVTRRNAHLRYRESLQERSYRTHI
jgi:hypothetical protein